MPKVYTADSFEGVATTVVDDAVTNVKLNNMIVNTIKGRITAGTGDPEDLTATQVRTIINVADGANNYVQDPAQITITTAVSITTDTLGDSGKTQKEKNVIISNGVNAINITVNGGTDFLASYVKHGAGTITFVQGSGRTLINVNATAILNGAVGSTATISSIGTTDYLRISNA